MFKVNNKDNKTTERRHWRLSGIFIVNFEHISHHILVYLLLTWSKQLPAGFISFKQIVLCLWWTSDSRPYLFGKNFVGKKWRIFGQTTKIFTDE